MGAKYEFDKTRMEFRKVTHSVWTVLGKAVKYFLVTASLAVVYYVVFSFVINTDSERKLKRENQMYRQMYESLSAREELVGDVLDGLRVKDNEIYHRLFNSDAPDLGSIYSDGLLSDVDTIPDGLIVEYSRVRLDTLSRISDRVEANFRRVMEALSDRKADLPPMTNPLAGFSYARTGASVGDRINPFYKVKRFPWRTGSDLTAGRVRGRRRRWGCQRGHAFHKRSRERGYDRPRQRLSYTLCPP